MMVEIADNGYMVGFREISSLFNKLTLDELSHFS